MNAVRYDRYGATDVLRIDEVAEPAAPGDDEIRVRVAATSVNPKDTFVRKGRFAAMMDATFPKGCGYDLAGVVEAVGASVTTFAPGDRAFGMISGWEGRTCAEVVNVRSAEAAPAGTLASWQDLAAVPLAAQTALQALDGEAALASGARILINGASGGVGLFAIQIARARGAHVTAIASAASEDLCREMGAHAFVDYASLAVDAAFPGDAYDAVFDVFGNLAFERARGALRPAGTFVSTVPNAATFAAVAATRDATRGPRARLVVVQSRARDLETLRAMLDAGTLRVHLDSTYAMDDIAAAHARVESKHTRGKVVVTP